MKTDSIDLDALVQDTEDLDPLPASVARIAALLTEPDWELAEIARVIELDQALTMRLLRAANSAASGARRDITSVDQAVVRMGPGTVLATSIGVSVRARMEAPLPQYGLAAGELWRHSVAAALAVRAARPRVRASIEPHAFASALLHDVGKLVLARHLQPTLRTFTERACREGGLTLEEAQSEVLRSCHAEAGALVVRQWGLPECIALGVRYHHAPLHAPDEGSRRLAYQIALADAVAAASGAGCGTFHENPELTPAIAERLGITREGYEALCHEVDQELDAVLASYG